MFILIIIARCLRCHDAPGLIEMLAKGILVLPTTDDEGGDSKLVSTAVRFAGGFSVSDIAELSLFVRCSSSGLSSSRLVSCFSGIIVAAAADASDGDTSCSCVVGTMIGKWGGGI